MLAIGQQTIARYGLTPLFLALTLFTIPLSSTAKSVAIIVAMLLVFSQITSSDLKLVLRKSWCRAALVLFIVALLGCFWGSANLHEKMFVMEKYSKLLYLPIFALGFRDERARYWGLNAFLAAMLVTFLYAIGKTLPNFSLENLSAASESLFRNHIMTGHMMAFAAYLSALLALRQTGWQRWIYAAFVILFSFQVLFINAGRTGYVIYILLMNVYFLQTLPWRRALIACLTGCLLLSSIYFESPVMHQRVAQGVTDIQDYHQDKKDTPLGDRLQFHDYAKNLFLRHPVLGNGTGGFTHLYEQENPIASWSRKLLEPHSQYWLVTSEWGAVGLSLFLCLLGSLCYAAKRMSKQMQPIAYGLLLPFIVGNLSDSLLFYSGSGYFFLLMMALCLGEALQKDSFKRSQ